MIYGYERQVLNDVREILNIEYTDVKVDFDQDLGVLSIFYTEDDKEKGIEKALNIVSTINKIDNLTYVKSEVKLDNNGKFGLYDLSYKIEL